MSHMVQGTQDDQLEAYDSVPEPSPDPLAPSSAVVTAATTNTNTFTTPTFIRPSPFSRRHPGQPYAGIYTRSLTGVALSQQPHPDHHNDHNDNEDDLPPLGELSITTNGDGVRVAHPPLQGPSHRSTSAQEVTVHPPSRFAPSGTRESPIRRLSMVLEQYRRARAGPDVPDPCPAAEQDEISNAIRLRRSMQHIFLPDPPSESTLPVPSSSTAPQDDDRVPAASIPLEPQAAAGAAAAASRSTSDSQPNEFEEGEEDDDDDEEDEDDDDEDDDEEEEEEYAGSDVTDSCDTDTPPPLVDAPPPERPPISLRQQLIHQGLNATTRTPYRRINPRRGGRATRGCGTADGGHGHKVDCPHFWSQAGEFPCCEEEDEELQQQIRWELDLIQGRVDKDGDPIPPELQKSSALQSDEVSEILAQHLTRRLHHNHSHSHSHCRPPRKLPTAIR